MTKGKGNDDEGRGPRPEGGASTPGDAHYGPVRITKDGRVDGRSRRRTYRFFKITWILQPRTRALLDAIMERDGFPSYAVLLEVMLTAYMKLHGEIDKRQLPSDAELMEKYLEQRDLDDGKQG